MSRLVQRLRIAAQNAVNRELLLLAANRIESLEKGVESLSGKRKAGPAITKLDNWAAKKPGRSWECCFRPDRGWVVRLWESGKEWFGEGQGMVRDTANEARKAAAEDVR